MRFFKRIIFLVCISLIVCLTVNLDWAISKVNNINKVIVKENGKIILKNVESVYSVSSYNELYNSVKTAVENVNTSIKINLDKNYLSTKEEFLDTFKKINSYISPGQYLSSYSISYRNLSSYYIEIKYDGDINEIKKQRKMVKEKIPKIIGKIIKPSMTNKEKQKAIHDYIVENTYYDKKYIDNNETGVEVHTAYGALIKGKAVCDGYAIAMKDMLDYVGIENIIVTGKARNQPHAWNLIKIDNKWLHTDPTWNDTEYSLYSYYDKTSKEMLKTHSWESENYKETKDSLNL